MSKLINGAFPFVFNDVEFHMLKEKALYYPDKKSLLLADLHFGKAAHFRKFGIPIPEQPHRDDLKVLQRLILETSVKEVLILGDLFHSSLNAQWGDIQNFFESFPDIQFHLIKGNHDILPALSYQSPNLKVHVEPLIYGPLLLSHQPLDKVPEGFLNVCGHIHPGYALRSAGRQRLRLPCFYRKENLLILPAFGKFTGLYVVTCTSEDEIYVVTENKVMAINLMQ
ncbi:ligase-associated DNA damage response endonuclease PdeM [Pararhodonellum marinum]|uniref:ligase-associated DNA damage response endonuclease PdeM n=1 Tax=Pararhodonellum marinum TaxID=2755358 RepID=UPI00188E15CA|nr:ligase-associated DNA damage response endonuclease PdeM [Pararhodonellum marinum]